MTSAASLVELGERYWALGLPAAARSAFSRALAVAAPDDAAAARRLAEVSLAVGDVTAARRHAVEVAKREPGPAARLLEGQALLAAGELAAARRSFQAALDAASAGPLLRAKVRLGLAGAAAIAGDVPGAGANAMAALEEMVGEASRVGVSVAELGQLVDREIAVVEEACAQAAAFGRADDAVELVEAAAGRRGDAPLGLFRAALGVARQTQGDRAVDDAQIEAWLERERAGRPESRVVRLRVVERQLRRRYQDSAARQAAIAALEAMAEELAQVHGADATVELARVWFLLAAAFEDGAATVGRAEDAYRKGLQLRPGHAAAACRLALLMLDRGDSEGALAELERALRIDAGLGVAWRNAARMFDAQSPLLAAAVERLLDAAMPGAGTAAGAVAPHLVAATAEVARGDLLAGVHAHGHRVKNLLGIIGSRARSARKLAGEGELSERLRELEREVTALYEEWAQYLRSMEASGPTVEVIAVGLLAHEVVAAAQAKSTATISLHTASSLPDLRGDRMLLREALLNLVSNAAEASSHGSEVVVRVNKVATGGAPSVEIVISDSGHGIPKAHLAKILAPGFTTKESGSGVGLTIADRVISAHHGRLIIDSEEGRGTTITVLLPSDLGGFSTLGRLTARASEGAP